MQNLVEILKISQIVIGFFLIFIVLIQNKNMSLNLTSMGGGMGAVTKRGPEKVLFVTTVILGILFILNSLVYFLFAS